MEQIDHDGIEIDRCTIPAFLHNSLARRRGHDVEGHPDHFFLNSYMAQQKLSPFAGENFPFTVLYGYHFDSGLLGQYLGEVAPQTVSTTLKNGWAWTIPLTSRVGNGYVYSSTYTTADEAEKELRSRRTFTRLHRTAGGNCTAARVRYHPEFRLGAREQEPYRRAKPTKD